MDAPPLPHMLVTFTHQIEHFSKAHRLIAVEPRGQCLSTKTMHGNDCVNYDAPSWCNT